MNPQELDMDVAAEIRDLKRRVRQLEQTPTDAHPMGTVIRLQRGAALCTIVAIKMESGWYISGRGREDAFSYDELRNLAAGATFEIASSWRTLG